MSKTSRRRFLSDSTVLLATPFLAEQTAAPLRSAEPTSGTANSLTTEDTETGRAVLTEPAWREPGQTKDAAYLRTATLRYSAQGREIVGRNRTCFNNRPLYCDPNADGVVLAGDRPFVRLLAKPYVLGGLSLAIVRQGAGRWFHEYSEVESRYRCGRMQWRISDAALPGVNFTLEAVPIALTAGFALRFTGHGLLAGDRLVWAFGGARREGEVRSKWDPVMHGNPKVLKLGDPRKKEMDLGIDPERCVGNHATIDGQAFRLLATTDEPSGAVGKCDREGMLHIADGSAWTSPGRLLASGSGPSPMVCGAIDLRPGDDTLYWAVQAAESNAATDALPMNAPAKAFQEGAAYLQTVERLQVETPDPRLDAAVAAVCHAIDASCTRDPYTFRHGCMSFFIPFLGWRVIGGATALGWHERVKGDAAYYAALQVTDGGGRVRAQSDPQRELCVQGPESRFDGRGRIPRDTHMYNTQSQFFDQVIRDWRATADPELEKILRPALELHLEWARDCFDPDDDGLYESYINTLPTDSVWYNGGGSVEESAYAYYGHRAAMEMALRAGDAEAAGRHQRQSAKIHRAIFENLWLNDRGYFGLYVEQGGHGRVHSDAWVYSQFLPIDAGMTTPEQAVQSLYYTEWGLERIRLPFGGEVCQPSNWVPWKWSVRDMFGGDLCAQALAYFQTGMAEEGWQLLLGSTLESAYASSVPGGFSHIGGGTDFSDNTHMFARTVVEGLFGYRPDYPNGKVHVSPALPSQWPRASVRTPDFTLDFRQEGDSDHYRLTLREEAEVWFRLPIRAQRVRRVTVNGQDMPFHAEAGFGCTHLILLTAKLNAANVEVGLTGRVPHTAPVAIEGKVGEPVCLKALGEEVLHWRDLHDVVDSARKEGMNLSGSFASKAGYHMVWAEVKVGELPQWQAFKLHLSDPAGDAERAARTPRDAPEGARWTCLDLAPHYNGDIRTIFQQQYLSPRPQTCSVRLGVDGYSAWTFTYWKQSAPAIELDGLDQLSDGNGRISTPRRVPFRRFAVDKNIAFTSLWDNWPRAVTIPTDCAAEQIWMLVCGSTFPMQTRIANAEVRFHYADGEEEKLELVPPLNFWMLCPWGSGDHNYDGDYNYDLDAFCLPKHAPPTVQLGRNCRAMVLSWQLRPGARLKEITLEALSQDVVIGLMGVSLMNASG